MENGDEVSVLASVIDNKNSYTLDVYWQYYRVISEKEYMAKVKEKYDQNVLNIVLKRLVNDDFKW